jgi:ATP-dependent Clp protease protease subunit
MANVMFESVRGYDIAPIEDVFFKDRKIFFVGQVDENSCDELIKELIYMESMDDTAPITLFINSCGGSVEAGLSVYDTIRLLKSPVRAVVTGIAASMGSIILLACDSDKRYMLPNSRIMIHDCSWGRNEMGGKKPHEIEEELKQLKKTNEKLVAIIAERTGKTADEIAELTKSDSYFSAEEAVEFGLASEIIDSQILGELIKKE